MVDLRLAVVAQDVEELDIFRAGRQMCVEPTGRGFHFAPREGTHESHT